MMRTTAVILLLPAAVLALTITAVGNDDRVGDAFHLYSPNRSYAAEVEYSEGNSEFVPLGRITVRGPGDEVVYTLENTTHTLVDVADDGAMVGIDFDGPVSGAAKLHFYSTRGTELGTAEVGFLNEREFSGEGQHYAVNDGLNGVRLFGLDGQELHNFGPAGAFALSFDGSRAAVAHDQFIKVYEEGEEAYRAGTVIPLLRMMRFGDEVFGFVEKHHAEAWQDGRRLFIWNAPDGHRLVSLDIGDGMVLVGADDDASGHKRGTVFMLDLEGNEVGRLDLSYEKWNAFSPGVRFTGESGFEVTTPEGVSLYRWKEE